MRSNQSQRSKSKCHEASLYVIVIKWKESASVLILCLTCCNKEPLTGFIIRITLLWRISGRASGWLGVRIPAATDLSRQNRYWQFYCWTLGNLIGVSVTGPHVSRTSTVNFFQKLEMSSPKCASKHIFLELRLPFDILLSNLFIYLSNKLTTYKVFFSLCREIKAEIIQKKLTQVYTVTLNEILINVFHCSRILHVNS